MLDMAEAGAEKLTDRELVAASLADSSAYSGIVERYQAPLLRYIRRLGCRSQDDAEDILQETFIKAYLNLNGFDPDLKFSSWIYRIAHNEFINTLKKKKMEVSFFFETDIFFPHPVSSEKTEEQAERKIFAETLDKCLTSLSPKYREPLVLYYFEELDYKEISDIAQIPVSTVGVRLKRGKEMLKLYCINNNIKYE